MIATGGTGVTPRDVTPEALAPLVTKPIPGFGELFRQLSFAEIGASTIQSRAEAALCGQTYVFLLPGLDRRREARRREDPDPAARSPHEAVQLRDAAAADQERADRSRLNVSLASNPTVLPTSTSS